MRAILPQRLPKDHRDYSVVDQIERALVKQAKGPDNLRQQLPVLIRQAIDEVIDTPRTGRVFASELEKTEKTYIGTKVEILVRNFFHLPKGILDLKIADFDVDVKNTLGETWMIPREAVGMPCILVASDEVRQTCFFGLFVAHLSNLTPGLNQDQKRSVSSEGFKNIHWILANEAYPESFWAKIGEFTTKNIFRGASGSERISTLFREAKGRPISRDIVQAVAQQKDYMKRLRKNGGARDVLAREGVAILSGNYDKKIVDELGLTKIAKDEFISFEATTPDQLKILKKYQKIY